MNLSPLEQLTAKRQGKTPFRIGFPSAGEAGIGVYALTPETAALLRDCGFELMIESGAGVGIHYPDFKYASEGVRICSRKETLGADIVVMTSFPDTDDAKALREGCILLTAPCYSAPEKEAMRLIIGKKITAIDLLCIPGNEPGEYPLRDVISEVSGRAAILKAAATLADNIDGKGILFGGFPGVVACEVAVLGAGKASCAAAAAAAASGARVAVFDFDFYALRNVESLTGGRAVTSTPHTKVLVAALKKADVVIIGNRREEAFNLGQYLECLKEEVMVFDLCAELPEPEPLPGMTSVNLSNPVVDNSIIHGRRHYYNIYRSVPRSLAMGISNCLLSLLPEVLSAPGYLGVNGFVKRHQGAVFGYMGCTVNAKAATLLGSRPMDISILLQMT